MRFLTGALCLSNLENAVNAAEANLKGKERLRKVVLEWTSRDANGQDEAKDEKVLKDLQPHHTLEEMHIFHYKGSNFPHWIRDGMLQNLSTISFNHCTKCKVLTLGLLPHLEQLSLKGLLELEKWQDGPYHSLLRLKISNCPKLVKLPSSFPILQVLQIEECPLLGGIPHLEIDDSGAPSPAQVSKKRSFSGPWFQRFLCRRGLNSKIKIEEGESSGAPNDMGMLYPELAFQGPIQSF
uniref:Putative disease resistance RPP13-like protein 1 n=1 Tax=Rhizophora mucronata TaxID=61149 RepID=A0A2P2LJB6_RHIMU